MHLALGIGLILALPALLVAPPASSQPPAWWETTMLDTDHDGLDDALAPLLHGSDPLTVLVDYAAMPTSQQRDAIEHAGFVITFAPTNFPLLVARGPAALVPQLRHAPGVVFVEKNDVLHTLLKESVPLIGAPHAWKNYGATGKGIVVAVLDDGAFEQHPDLSPKLAGDYDASFSSSFPFDIPVGIVAPAGTEGHGTHVAGTIVGQGGQSGGVYRGVAPDADFVNVKVFSGPNQTTSDIVIKGLDWTVTQMGPLHIRIASMSLGGRPSDGTDALSRAIDISVDKGLIVVAAAGNAGPDPKTVSSPGAAVKAITVGAVDKQKHPASFSSRGPTLDGRTKPDIAAPGVGITSTIPPFAQSPTSIFGVASGGKNTIYYGSLSGTSMATPHVAGVAALMLDANNGLTPIQVKQILLVTAQDLGAEGPDNETGFGLVNAVAAVQVAKDPTLLQQAAFRDRLAIVPDPPPATLLERLSYEAAALVREGKAPYVASAVVAGTAVLIFLAAVLIRRR